MEICRWALVAIGVVGVALFGCAEKPAVKGPIPPGDYTVLDAEDNLSNISLRAYGDMKYWYGLLNANPELEKRPWFDLIPGETIKVPAKDKLNMKQPISVFPKELPADYIVMPGDSLPFIAKGCYGDKELWMRIYEANRNELSSKVKDNPRLLMAGQVLHIPAKPGGESPFARQIPQEGASPKGTVPEKAGGGQSPFAPRTSQKGTVPAGQVLHIPAKPMEQEASKIKAAEANAISTAK